MGLLTYDSLREVLRKQKDQKSLVEVSPDFYRKAAAYIGEIESVIQRLEGETEEFSSKRLALKREELENAKSTLKDICTIRGGLILSLAWEKTALSLPVSKEALTPEEESMFSSAKQLAENNWDLFLSFLEGNEPGETVKKEVSGQRLKVRVKAPLPAFVGTDLNTYGPYEGGEEVELPRRIAEMLERQGKAESGENR